MNDLSDAGINHVLIRSMQVEDLSAVREIDQLSFSLPWPESAFAYELHENPDSLLWVAAANDSNGAAVIVGMIVVWLIVDETHIATIAVHPDYRGQGISKALMKAALTETVRRGFSIATLEVRANNKTAQNLYRRFGFEIVGGRPRYYRDNNEDALIMTVKGLDLLYLEWMNNNL